ncbi:MAG: NUDIX hydrolase [Calditrichaeota bacterium]|nr:MAG: NUDIX hydrolase [Calditrichota bacterium]
MIQPVSLDNIAQYQMHRRDVIEEELLELADRYGPTNFYLATLTIGDDYFRTWRHSHVYHRNRRGEIVLVIRNRQDRILLHTKPFYPADVYRLPTGGIRERETVISSLYREIYEETSFKPLSIQLCSVVLYHLQNKEDIFPFNSYIFKIEPDGEHPKPVDLAEEISGFEWIPESYLTHVVAKLEGLYPQRWRDWGKIRAVAHRIVGGMMM